MVICNKRITIFFMPKLRKYIGDIFQPTPLLITLLLHTAPNHSPTPPHLPVDTPSSVKCSKLIGNNCQFLCTVNIKKLSWQQKCSEIPRKNGKVNGFFAKSELTQFCPLQTTSWNILVESPPFNPKWSKMSLFFCIPFMIYIL